MSTSGNGFGAVGYAIIATHFLFSVFESMISMMFVNLLVTRSDMHLSNVINILIFFWIKLVSKLPKFLNSNKLYHFDVIFYINKKLVLLYVDFFCRGILKRNIDK